MGENKTEEEYRLLAEESKERFDELTERMGRTEMSNILEKNIGG